MQAPTNPDFSSYLTTLANLPPDSYYHWSEERQQIEIKPYSSYSLPLYNIFSPLIPTFLHSNNSSIAGKVNEFLRKNISLLQGMHIPQLESLNKKLADHNISPDSDVRKLLHEITERLSKLSSSVPPFAKIQQHHTEIFKWLDPQSAMRCTTVCRIFFQSIFDVNNNYRFLRRQIALWKDKTLLKNGIAIGIIVKLGKEAPEQLILSEGENIGKKETDALIRNCRHIRHVIVAGECRITEEAFSNLVENLGSLQTLTIEKCDLIGPMLIQALQLSSPCCYIKTLELELSPYTISKKGLEIFANMNFSSLRKCSLNLQRCSAISGHSFSLLVNSPIFNVITNLNVSWCNLDDMDIAVLVKHSNSRQLRHLNLSLNSNLTDETLKYIASSRYLALDTLNLDYCDKITMGAVARIFSSPESNKPKALTLKSLQ